MYKTLSEKEGPYSTKIFQRHGYVWFVIKENHIVQYTLKLSNNNYI